MTLLNLNFFWLLMILLILNFLITAPIRTEEKYWLPHMILWIFLFGWLLFRNTMNLEQVIQKEMVYQQQTDPESKENLKAILDLEHAKTTRIEQNRMLIRLVGCQSFIGFMMLMIGYRRTSKISFSKGAITFLLFFLAYLILECIWFFNKPLSDGTTL